MHRKNRTQSEPSVPKCLYTIYRFTIFNTHHAKIKCCCAVKCIQQIVSIFIHSYFMCICKFIWISFCVKCVDCCSHLYYSFKVAISMHISSNVLLSILSRQFHRRQSQIWCLMCVCVCVCAYVRMLSFSWIYIEISIPFAIDIMHTKYMHRLIWIVLDCL